MVMGSVDMAVTRSLKAKEERFQQTMKRLTKELERQKIDSVVTQCIDEEMIPVQTESCSDPEFVCPPTPPIHGKSVGTLALPNLSRECDRWNVSNRTGATIASATLVDFQIVTEGNKSLVIDKNKLARKGSSGERFVVRKRQRTWKIAQQVSILMERKTTHLQERKYMASGIQAQLPRTIMFA